MSILKACMVSINFCSRPSFILPSENTSKPSLKGTRTRLSLVKSIAPEVYALAEDNNNRAALDPISMAAKFTFLILNNHKWLLEISEAVLHFLVLHNHWRAYRPKYVILHYLPVGFVKCQSFLRPTSDPKQVLQLQFGGQDYAPSSQQRRDKL